MSLEERLAIITREIPERTGWNVVVVGAQWGDEGKGKTVDVLAKNADAVVRFSGGRNAGHTICYFDETLEDFVSLALHMIPSGALNPDAPVVLADGVAMEPDNVLEEMASLPDQISLDGRFYVSENANIVTPMHIFADTNAEKAGKGVGSTKNGMGPCYQDRAGRRALTPDIVLNNPAYGLEVVKQQMEHWGYDEQSAEEVFEKIWKDTTLLAEKTIITNTVELINQWIDEGLNVLFEGAQGTMLDVVHGTGRYVTSSHPTAGGACVGAGVGPTKIDDVIGIVKLTTTRVGDGPFPSQLVDEKRQLEDVMSFIYGRNGITKEIFDGLHRDKQNAMRKEASSHFKLPEIYTKVIDNMVVLEDVLDGGKIGEGQQDLIESIFGSDFALESLRQTYDHIVGMYMMATAGEFGATTGRPRRTGWVDITQLNYAKQVNGFTHLALTKLDCLGDMPLVNMVKAYESGGETLTGYPMSDPENAEPVYETFEGWSSADVRKARSFEELPVNAQKYVARISELTDLPISSIGVGPNPDETITLYNPFEGGNEK